MQRTYLANMKIAIIDDSKMELFIHNKLIDSFFPKKEVYTFQHATDFLQHITNNPSKVPNIILSDYHMPELNGIELLEKVNQIISETSLSKKQLIQFYLLSSENKLRTMLQDKPFSIFSEAFEKPLSKKHMQQIKTNFEINQIQLQ
ncbi:MAG: response regulator [Bacteroidota bacterium]